MNQSLSPKTDGRTVHRGMGKMGKWKDKDGNTHELLLDLKDAYHTKFFLATQHLTDNNRLFNSGLFTKNIDKAEMLWDFNYKNEGLYSENVRQKDLTHPDPNKKIVGINQLVKVVKIYSERLQLQERLTQKIAEVLEDELKPQGVAVMIEAEHFCMSMRGVQKPGTKQTIL